MWVFNDEGHSLWFKRWGGGSSEPTDVYFKCGVVCIFTCFSDLLCNIDPDRVDTHSHLGSESVLLCGAWHSL